MHDPIVSIQTAQYSSHVSARATFDAALDTPNKPENESYPKTINLASNNAEILSSKIMGQYFTEFLRENYESLQHCLH